MLTFSYFHSQEFVVHVAVELSKNKLIDSVIVNTLCQFARGIKLSTQVREDNHSRYSGFVEKPKVANAREYRVM